MRSRNCVCDAKGYCKHLKIVRCKSFGSKMMPCMKMGKFEVAFTLFHTKYTLDNRLLLQFKSGVKSPHVWLVS